MDTATTSTMNSGDNSNGLLESLKAVLAGGQPTVTASADAQTQPAAQTTNLFGQTLTPEMKQKYANLAEQSMNKIPMSSNYAGMPIQQGYSSQTSSPQWAQYQ